MPHLLCPVVTEPKKAARALRRLVNEMERRYIKLAEAGVRNLQAYWEKVEATDPQAEELPAIVVVIDELADLMLVAANEVEDAIARLAQMARGVGIHLVFATQNPAVTVITGTIKANFPSRIAFRVPSMVNSRTILDSNGAEALLGRGDMLYHPAGAPKPERIQGCYVSTEEVKAIVAHWRDQGETQYLMENLAEADPHESEGDEGPGIDPQDAQYLEAKRIVIQTQIASTSLLQRRISIGYGKAARLLDQMEREGLVGPPRGSRPREVLVKGLDSKPGSGEAAAGGSASPEET
jgi:S-DNA-T family DNA segregation ATPase FtsK/SpoIIIE